MIKSIYQKVYSNLRYAWLKRWFVWKKKTKCTRFRSEEIVSFSLMNVTHNLNYGNERCK